MEQPTQAEALRLASLLLDLQTHLGPRRDEKDLDEQAAWDGYTEAAAELRRQHALLDEQQRTIAALNSCIGGDGSTTTENLRLVDRLQAELESLRASQQAERAVPAEDDVRKLIGPLLNEFGERQWQSGAGVSHKSLEDAFEAVVAAANTLAAPVQQAAPAIPYSIDFDPQGIRATMADAITGALAFGAQGVNQPPDGHWLAPFWNAARAER